MYYKKGIYIYMFLKAIVLPVFVLHTLYRSIVGVIVHRQRKENASIAPDPAGDSASVQLTMQAARRQRRAIRVAATCAVVTILFLAWLSVWIISFQFVFRLGQVGSIVLSWTIVFIYLHSSMNLFVYLITDDRFCIHIGPTTDAHPGVTHGNYALRHSPHNHLTIPFIKATVFEMV